MGEVELAKNIPDKLKGLVPAGTVIYLWKWSDEVLIFFGGISSNKKCCLYCWQKFKNFSLQEFCEKSKDVIKPYAKDIDLKILAFIDAGYEVMSPKPNIKELLSRQKGMVPSTFVTLPYAKNLLELTIKDKNVASVGLVFENKDVCDIQTDIIYWLKQESNHKEKNKSEPQIEIVKVVKPGDDYRGGPVSLWRKGNTEYNITPTRETENELKVMFDLRHRRRFLALGIVGKGTFETEYTLTNGSKVDIVVIAIAPEKKVELEIAILGMLKTKKQKCEVSLKGGKEFVKGTLSYTVQKGTQIITARLEKHEVTIKIIGK